MTAWKLGSAVRATVGIALVCLALAGCGDSGNKLLSAISNATRGGETPSSSTGRTVTGTVSAPSGRIASLSKPHEWTPLKWLASLLVGESYAQNIPLPFPFPNLRGDDSLPVPNTPVIAYQIDDLGRPLPLGNPTILAQTTTNANGEFTLTLPPDSGVDTIVSAGQVTPVPICTPGTPGCSASSALYRPAVGTRLDLNPATTLATRRLVGSLPPGSTLRGAYTDALVLNFIGFVMDRALSIVGSTIEEVINNTQTNSDAGSSSDDPLHDFLSSLSIGNLLGSLPQTPLTGEYQYTVLSQNMASNGVMEQRVSSGSVRFNQDGTFSWSASSSGGKLQATCSTICTRQHTVQSIIGTGTGTGLYLVLPGNKVLLHFISTNGEEGQLQIQMNQAHTLGYWTHASSRTKKAEMALGFLVKKPDAFSIASLQGHASFVAFEEALAAGSGDGTWVGPVDAATETALLTFTGSNVSGSESWSRMSQSVTCKSASQLLCEATARLMNVPGGGPVPNGATLTVETNGATQLTFPSEPPLSGQLSADGQLIVLNQVQNQPDFSVNRLFLGVMQGSGMTPGSLKGTYQVAEIGRRLATQHAGIGQKLVTGIATFDGAGHVKINTVESSHTRQDCSGTEPCNFPITTHRTTNSMDLTYTVSSTGQVTIPWGNSPLTGWLSPDGSVVVFTEQSDSVVVGGDSLSERAVGLSIKLPVPF